VNQRLGFTLQKNTKIFHLTFFQPISFFSPYVLNFANKDFSRSIYKEKEGLGHLFLAYFLQARKKTTILRIDTNLFLLRNILNKDFVCFITPFTLILLSLEKQNFCNINGYPKTKSGWTTWNDGEIVEHFEKIWTAFFLFYSGCQNRKNLSRIRYILKYSCAKTLACKHKTNLRTISRKFGMNLKSKKTFSVRKKKKESQIQFLQRREKLNRVWNLQLTYFDYQVSQLDHLF
jgi:hypothetical protein